MFRLPDLLTFDLQLIGTIYIIAIETAIYHAHIFSSRI